MFSGKYSDDDDDLFSPKPSQHLANLFNAPMQQTEDEGLPSLKYVAPKQSAVNNSEKKLNPATTTTATAPQNTVVLAKRITAYKYNGNQYIVQGMLALAIIEVTKSQYKVILYKDKQNIISSSNFNKDSKITVQDRYCYFADDLLRNWAVLFENETDLNDFTVKMNNVDVQITKNVDTKANVPEKQSNDQSKDDHNSEIKDTKAKILSLMEKMGQTKLLPEIHSTVDNTTDSSDTENLSSSRDAPKVISKPLAKPRKIDKSITAVKSFPQNNTMQYMLINGQLVPIVQSQQSTSNAISLQSNSLSHNPQWTAPMSTSNSNESLNMYLCENRIHNSELRMNISKLEQKIEKVLDKIDDVKLESRTDINDEISKWIRKQEQAERKHANEIEILRSQLNNIKESTTNISENGHSSNDIPRKNCESEYSISEYEDKIQNSESKIKDFDFHEKDPLLKKYEEAFEKLRGYEIEIEILKLKQKDFDERYKENTQHSASYQKEIDDLTKKLTDKEIENLDHINTIENLRLKLKDFEDFLKDGETKRDDLHENEIISLKKQLSSKDEEISDLKKTNEEIHEKLKNLEISNQTLNDKLKENESKSENSEIDIAESLNDRIKLIMNGVFALLTEKFPTEETFRGSEILQGCRHALKVTTLEALRNLKEENQVPASGDRNRPVPLPPDFDVV